MKAEVFVPGHLTGFFEIFDSSKPEKKGSRGAGVVIDRGVTTKMKLKASTEPRVSVSINGKKSDAPVTSMALEEIISGVKENYKIEVTHKLDIPAGQGFGTSGAGTLGAVIAVNKALELNLTYNQCGMIAHKAEVLNNTGLGDVIAELNGGLVIRKREGGPGTGDVDKVFDNSYVVAGTLGPPLKTEEIITHPDTNNKINQVGNRMFKVFLEKPSRENFLKKSREFAFKSGLASRDIRQKIKELEEKNIISSMVMLGNAVFTLSYEPEKVEDILGEKHITAKIDPVGARLL